MAFCTVCGANHHADEEDAAAAMDREVEMERLRTKRDIEVARIQAGVTRDTAETYTESEETIAAIEAESGVLAAEAVAEVLEDIVTPETEPEAEGSEPVIVEAVNEPEQETIEPKDNSGEPPETDKKSNWSYW